MSRRTMIISLNDLAYVLEDVFVVPWRVRVLHETQVRETEEETATVPGMGKA